MRVGTKRDVGRVCVCVWLEGRKGGRGIEFVELFSNMFVRTNAFLLSPSDSLSLSLSSHPSLSCGRREESSEFYSDEVF